MNALGTYQSDSAITYVLCVFRNFIISPFLELKNVHCISGITVCYIDIQYASTKAYILGIVRGVVAMEPGCV